MGIRHGIPICCITFFETTWVNYVKYEIAEYTDTMLKLTDNEQGVILCPDCVVKSVTGMSV